uniref:Nudix hydrolase domain-containing protein n=1 Tax=Chenopodium quinoa TaxID=63459 RepID=A0A803LCQ7_CHEQI
MAEIGNYDVTSSLPYKLMLSCPSGLLPSQVSVIFDKLYDRIPHPDFDLEKSVDQIWDQRAQQNTSLYNGKKFRYGGHAFHSAGGVDCKSDCYLNLHLGLTDYRTFVGTNLNPLWEKFLVQSEDETVRCQHTSNPLGNGGIVETSDGKILVLKRSNNVGEFPGHFVFPGGHPESNPVFIGISRRELNVRPTAFFFMKCSLQSKEIEKLYSSAQDGFESTQLCTISKDELESVAWKMPGCHHGGLALYKLMEDAN